MYNGGPYKFWRKQMDTTPAGQTPQKGSLKPVEGGCRPMPDRHVQAAMLCRTRHLLEVTPAEEGDENP
jgi:hypothetical protein